MTNQEYLESVLRQQALSASQVNQLRTLRDRVQGVVAKLQGNPRFYYAGSYAKNTMVCARYDLDVVAYWPADCGYTLKGIFEGVGKVLEKEWTIKAKTVAWEIPFEGGFHVDVVPGRALDSSFVDANLYRRDNDSSLKTSLKTHIHTIRDSGRRDAIRLMKYWGIRAGVPLKTFVLELMTIEGCKGKPTDLLESRLIAAFQYLRDRIETARIVDPANSNNVLSDAIATTDKAAVKRAAQAALSAKYWSEVFS